MSATPLTLLAAAIGFAATCLPAAAAEPVKVIASFSIIGDLVRNVGGEHVELVTLVGPDGDAHVYEPTPADARATGDAGLVVVNGLGFEGWLDRLVEASGFKGSVAVASEGVRLRGMADAGQVADPRAAEGHGHDGEAAHEHESAASAPAHDHDEDHRHEGADPHAWQSVANAVIYVENIAKALCAAEPSKCSAFKANAARYTEELQALDASIKRGFAAIPGERRKVITTHDAFGYFGQAYGIEFLAPQGVSTDSEASARDVAELIRQTREQGVTALFVENISDPRLIEQIGRETGIVPGGELFSDALSGPDGPAPTYIEMMRHNAGVLQAAMQGS